MTGEMFEKIVKARAEERMQEKIAKFKSVCKAAVIELCPMLKYTFWGDQWPPVAAKSFAVLASATNREGWPKELWAAEREAVVKELLGTMDELQKAFLAASQPARPEDEFEQRELDPDGELRDDGARG